MLQRKQTALLAFAVISLLQLFLFPVYGFEKDGQQTLFFIYGLDTLNPDFFVLIALNVFSIFLLAAIIFLYKNRKQQMLLCKIATLLIAGLIVAIFYFAKNVEAMGGYTSEIQPILVAPLVALVLVILANRFIKKDEELVRSADRLR